MKQLHFEDVSDIFSILELDKDVCNDILDNFTYGDDKTSYTLIRTKAFSDALKTAVDGRDDAEQILNDWREYSIHNMIGINYINIEN
jgi:hypothetical protein